MRREDTDFPLRVAAAKVSEIEAMRQLGELPARFPLPTAAQRAVAEAFERMASDSRRPATTALQRVAAKAIGGTDHSPHQLRDRARQQAAARCPTASRRGGPQAAAPRHRRADGMCFPCTLRRQSPPTLELNSGSCPPLRIPLRGSAGARLSIRLLRTRNDDPSAGRLT